MTSTTFTLPHARFAFEGSHLIFWRSHPDRAIRKVTDHLKSSGLSLSDTDKIFSFLFYTFGHITTTIVQLGIE
jgi:hypothetical protein